MGTVFRSAWDDLARDLAYAFRGLRRRPMFVAVTALSLGLGIGWHLEDALSQERLTAWLLSSLGILALVLAAVGIYGVQSYCVAQRTREMGIRMALGAGSLHIQRGLTVAAMLPVIAGLVLGVAVAFALGRMISSLHYGVSPGDPIVYVTTVVALLAVAAVAAYIPARRAATVDPAVALRCE